MSTTIFITGGARSGKSRLAERLAEGFGAPLCYIATGEARDGEMAERIDRHRQRRGSAWQTVEEPLQLGEAIRERDGRCRAILVDCITLWITNLLFHHDAVEPVLVEVRTLAELLPTLQTPLILVSNEVGMGIVPENALARSFRDLAGHTNQILAEASDEVYVTISGIPVKLK
ncbi:MAG: bifunctional adenosylcobinamide kinase/adenosylcobinamide-phosphate guanylyltransferase [Deltaproteobacteria bacterium]|nr:bifunctional adenosylcobinamide kinase/adenosylcobinamide-phosphate guanylyltransferase [Deltaproteobacteria bacterium]TLN01475.1 MAG: bifunctional adenosylcobinamide kinase/adenosylcobinamide-phosphate guanylyltransferase [bacterium]